MNFSELKENDQYAAIARMETAGERLYGSRFQSALALAWYLSRGIERDKLNLVFGDTFMKYIIE